MTRNRPDIVWIVADQLHHQAVGYAGNPAVKTPNIDRLAASGRIFTDAYCQQPLCMPSRSSFNTGFYPQTTRVHNNPSQLPDDVPTLADRLKPLGYHTAAFGHIGGDGLGRRFDRKTDWWDAPLRQCMQAECDALLPGTERLAAHTCGVHPVPEEELFDVVATDLAVQAIAEMPSPLFLQLDFYGPHIPWFVPRKYLDLYDRADIPLPDGWNESVSGKPTSLKGARVATRMEGIGEERLREALHHYYARISMADAQVGRILRALEDRGNLENTVVVFFADHGDYAGEFGMIGKNRFLYDCLSRVPLVVRTGARLGTVSGRIDSPVALVDLVPTCLELAGADVPADLPGRSLAGPREDFDEQRAVFASYLNARGKPVPFDHEWSYDDLEPGPFDPYGSGTCWGDGCIMVRQGGHKLILYRSGAMELFDLARDPGERRNLYGREGTAAITHELMIRLLQWQMGTGLPDIPQEGLPYHFRSFVRRRIPQKWKAEWDRWQQRVGCD